MTRPDVLEHATDQPGGGSLRDLRLNTPVELLREGRVAADVSAFDHRSPGFKRLPVKCDRLIDRPDAVTDVDACVPEEMEDGLRGFSRRFQEIPRVAQDHDIDVGVGTQLSPPVSPQREYCYRVHHPRREAIARGPDCLIRHRCEVPACEEPTRTTPM